MSTTQVSNTSDILFSNSEKDGAKEHQGRTYSELKLELKERLETLDRDGSILDKSLPEKSSKIFTPKRKCLGITAFAVAVLFISSYALIFTGGLNNFPQGLLNSFRHMNLMHLAIGGGVAAVLLGGAAIVIVRVMFKKDKLLDHAGVGKLSGSDHIKEAVYYSIGKNAGTKEREVQSSSVYIDTSTLKNGNGKAYLYGVKQCGEHYSVSSVVTLTTPIYLVGTVALDCIRLVIAPFYIAGCWVIERFRNDPLFEGQRKFELSDIPVQMAISIKRIAVAPFYATAYFFAAFSSLFSPINGRKLASLIERDWNEDVSRAQGFWSVRGPQALWPGIKALSPDRLKENAGYYWAGCWQPMGVVEYRDGNIVDAMSLSKAVNSNAGQTYYVRTADGKGNPFVEES